MKFYGTELCPDCVEAERLLKDKKIEYDYVRITETTANLKEFLKLRDGRTEFEEIKKEGYIGIPCFLMEDGTIAFSAEKICVLPVFER